MSWIINTKTSHIYSLHFIFCIALQYIQVYNTYIISITYTHTHTRTQHTEPSCTPLNSSSSHLRASVFAVIYSIQILAETSCFRRFLFWPHFLKQHSSSFSNPYPALFFFIVYNNTRQIIYLFILISQRKGLCLLFTTVPGTGTSSFIHSSCWKN